MDVLCAEERSSAYLDHDAEKNIFGSFYHVREPKTRKLPMTLPEFAACLRSWASKKLLLKVCPPSRQQLTDFLPETVSYPMLLHSKCLPDIMDFQEAATQGEPLLLRAYNMYPAKLCQNASLTRISSAHSSVERCCKASDP